MSLETLAAIFRLQPPNGTRQLALSCGKCLSQITATEKDGRVVFVCSGGCSEDQVLVGLAAIEPRFATWWLEGGLTDDGRGIEEGIRRTGEPNISRGGSDRVADDTPIHIALETQTPRQGFQGRSGEAVAESERHLGEDHVQNSGLHLKGQRPDLQSWKMMLYALGQRGIETLIAQGHGKAVAVQELDAFIAQVERLRNLPKIWQTNDPEGLSETEIAEELVTVAVALQQKYTERAALETPSNLPVVIPWEGFAAALVANDSYLQRAPVVDKLCYSSAVSMITGGKHAGKSTLARWMAICVVKGWSFLKRDVLQGPVCYIASDDETMPARQELLRLGWTLEDPLRFLAVGASGVDDRIKFLELLSRDIKEFGAKLVILDMLFDFVDIRDEMSYAATREGLGRIQKVASDTGAHIVAIHHAPKHAQTGDAAVAALGSQGLAARVSPIILVRRFGPGVHSVVSTNVRDPRGEAIAESRLTRNEDGSVVLGGIWKTYMLAEAYAPRVLDFLNAEEGAEATASDVVIALDMAYEVVRACLSSLWKGGYVTRTGSGKKGQPYRYSSISPSNEKKSDKYPTYPPSVGDGEIPESRDQGSFGYKD